MRLWSVRDDMVLAWMENLYTAHLEDGQATAEAVRTASRRLLEARRAAGESTHPFYWAGFVAAGDWR